MKKYCFTECFKRKMSAGMKAVLGVLLIMGVFLALVLVFSGVAYGIGFGIEYFFGEAKEMKRVEVGMATMIFGAIFSVIAYWLFLLGRWIFRGSFNFVVARYEGEPFKCNIIEECKEQ